MNESLSKTLERILANVKRTPDTRTFSCRCGSWFKQGREVSVGWVEVSEEGRGTWRRCEVCNRVNVSAVSSSREKTYS